MRAIVSFFIIFIVIKSQMCCSVVAAGVFWYHTRCVFSLQHTSDIPPPLKRQPNYGRRPVAQNSNWSDRTGGENVSARHNCFPQIIHVTSSDNCNK